MSERDRKRIHRLRLAISDLRARDPESPKIDELMIALGSLTKKKRPARPVGASIDVPTAGSR